MKKLKTTFELPGFTNVVTHINSGNIIFECVSVEQGITANKIEKAIKKDFRSDIKVLLRSFKNIEIICKKLTDTWGKSEVMRTDVMFLREKFDDPKIIAHLQINVVDNVKYISGAVLWHVEGKNYSKSGMLKLVGTELYRNMTIRNVNTGRKLHQIMTEIYRQTKATNR